MSHWEVTQNSLPSPVPKENKPEREIKSEGTLAFLDHQLRVYIISLNTCSRARRMLSFPSHSWKCWSLATWRWSKVISQPEAAPMFKLTSQSSITLLCSHPEKTGGMEHSSLREAGRRLAMLKRRRFQTSTGGQRKGIQEPGRYERPMHDWVQETQSQQFSSCAETWARGWGMGVGVGRQRLRREERNLGKWDPELYWQDGGWSNGVIVISVTLGVK